MMMLLSSDVSKHSAVILALLLLLGLTPDIQAQVTIRPSLGIQSFEFLGEPLAKLEMSPGNARSLPLGGGIVGPQIGARLELDIIPDPEGIISFPVVFEGYSLVGKTTFSLSSFSADRKQRLTFTHDANFISAGIGVKASFFDLPKLYGSVTGRYNHILPNNLTSRIFYSDNNETLIENTVEPHPEAAGRIGANFRIGTTVAFFEPLLLDFNLNLGVLNLAAKDTDPETQKNLLTVDSQRHDPEGTITYFGVGISVIWKM